MHSLCSPLCGAGLLHMRRPCGNMPNSVRRHARLAPGCGSRGSQRHARPLARGSPRTGLGWLMLRVLLLCLLAQCVWSGRLSPRLPSMAPPALPPTLPAKSAQAVGRFGEVVSATRRGGKQVRSFTQRPRRRRTAKPNFGDAGFRYGEAENPGPHSPAV